VRGVDGEFLLVPESAGDDAAAATAPPEGDNGAGAPAFSAVPVGSNHKLSPESKSWFLALPQHKPRRDGTPNASHLRRLPNADVRTMDHLGPLQGLHRDDVLFVLARGAILVPSRRLPGGAFTTTVRPQPVATPTLSHPETATQESIRCLASLEGSNHDPDPKDVETACNDLRP
jgi:hypothetical protein